MMSVIFFAFALTFVVTFLDLTFANHHYLMFLFVIFMAHVSSPPSCYIKADQLHLYYMDLYFQKLDELFGAKENIYQLLHTLMSVSELCKEKVTIKQNDISKIMDRSFLKLSIMTELLKLGIDKT